MLTIDFSLRSTGYTIWKEDKLSQYGIINTDVNDTPFKRAEYISNTLIELIISNDVKEVLIESPAFGAKGANEYILKGGHFFTVAIITNKLGIEVKQVAPTSIKKQFTGSGRAKKEAMIEYMPIDVLDLFKKNYSKSTGLSDLVDAYALGWIQFNKIIKDVK